MRTAAPLAATLILLTLAACSTTDTTPTPEAQATTNLDAATAPLTLTVDPIDLVRRLAADELGGRNNDTEQSALARRLLIDALRPLADPAGADSGTSEGSAGTSDGAPTDDAAYLQPYEDGTNILARIPGSGSLADEYVIVGAHYDHFGPGECDQLGTTDTICNGAADNAAGVVQVIAIADALRQAQTADPAAERRSVLLALWDGEEDGLFGSAFYAANPVVPLDQTVVYVNFDIQGSSFAPALSSATFLVGAETGGPPLESITASVAAASPLDVIQLSRIFAQGLSDHRTFAERDIPIVFLTDAPNGCYHTVHDDFAHLDTPKLLDQIDAATRLVLALTTHPERPRFATDLPPATYADADHFLRLLTRALDANLFDPTPATEVRAAATQLQTIVTAGPDAFGVDATVTLLAAAAVATDQLAALDCP